MLGCVVVSHIITLYRKKKIIIIIIIIHVYIIIIIIIYIYMMKKIMDLKPSEEHVVLKMSSFDWYLRHKRSWFLYPSHGYKLCLDVDAGPHLSAVHLLVLYLYNDDGHLSTSVLSAIMQKHSLFL